MIAAAAVPLLAASNTSRLEAQETVGACSKAAFETVVDDAAEALRNLNAKNKPAFQEKLRQLKEKRGWSQDQFLKEATPYVKDDQIEAYEKTSNQHLAKITAMGQEGSSSKSPDCTMLSTLHASMLALVETQTAKWTYMFGKLDGELAK